MLLCCLWERGKAWIISNLKDYVKPDSFGWEDEYIITRLGNVRRRLTNTKNPNQKKGKQKNNFSQINKQKE